VIETSYKRAFDHIRLPNQFKHASFKQGRGVTVEFVSNDGRVERYPLQFQVEPDSPRTRTLRIALSGLFPHFSGIHGCERKKVRHRRHSVGVDVVLIRIDLGQFCYGRVLLGETLRIGVPVRTQYPQLRKRQTTYRGCGDGPEYTCIQQCIVYQNGETVVGQVYVRLNRRDSDIEGNLESGKRIFGFQSTSAAVALEIEKRHDLSKNQQCATKNLAE
jgi:hypothetical protein